MNITKFIDKLLTELSYRVKEGYPILDNKEHIRILSDILREWGLGDEAHTFIYNLTEADEKRFRNPILNKEVEYVDDKGNKKVGLVGNLLRLQKDTAGRKAAERLLPAEGSEERKEINRELGGENQPNRDDISGSTQSDSEDGETPQTPAVTVFDKETKGGEEYLKNLPDNDPAKPDEFKDDSKETKSGGVVYPVGNGYYADTPDGKPKYRVAVEEHIDKNHFKYILEAESEEEGDTVIKTVDGTGGKRKPMIVLDPNLSNLITPNDNDSAVVARGKQNVAAAINAIDVQFKKLADTPNNPYAEEHRKVGEIMAQIFSGNKISDDDKKFIKQYIRIAEPSASKLNSAKYYIAKEPNNFKNRIRVVVGSKQGSTHIAKFREYTQQAGLEIISPSTFGTKLTTANQTFVDSEGKTKLLKNEDGSDYAKLEKDENGNPTKVIIGDSVIVRLNENEEGISDEERVIRQRSNRNMDEYAKSIEKGDLQFIDMDNGLSPNTPQNRVVVIKSALSGMADRLKALADKEGVKSDRIHNIINSLKNFSDKDPNVNPNEWFRELNSIMSSIANDKGNPSLKESWPNYAEIYAAIVEMHDGGNGTENGSFAVLPKSTTLETVDILIVNEGNTDNQIVTLGGKSVKKGKGGASALTAKVNKSMYKDDTDGLKKQKILDLTKSYDDIYSVSLEDSTEVHKDHHSKFVDNLIQNSKELGVGDDIINKLRKSIQPGGSGYNSVNKALEAVKAQREKGGKNVDTDTMNKIKMRLESYYLQNYLSHYAYNINVDVQDFTNVSVQSQSTDPGGAELVKNKEIRLDSSDGINVLAYIKPEFNVGWGDEGRSNNPGSGRFYNKSKIK